MTLISISQLKTLYNAKEISKIWDDSRNLPVINHPQYGFISPNKYRAIKKGKPCPYCGQKMVQGKKLYSTWSKKEAIKRGYEYVDKNGQKRIICVGNTYYHPNYVTIDHKINKARCPEKMFDYDNLEVICWKCNLDKGDDNSYEIQHTLNHLISLANEALSRYKLL